MKTENESPDIHDEEPEHKIPIDKVGVKNLLEKLNLDLTECTSQYYNIEVYVNLPSNKKGVHLSRIVKVVKEQADNQECMKTKTFIEKTLKKLLETHENTEYAETKLYTTIKKDDQIYYLGFGGKTEKEKIVETISIETMGITACPCAKEVYKYYEKTTDEKTPTHMQRARLKVELIGDNLLDPVFIEKILYLMKKSFSANLKELLTRKEEYLLLKKAISKPRFAEDIIRSIKADLTGLFKEKTKLKVSIESLESIHYYNVFAELGEY